MPDDTIKQNARLSLLYGETCGIRGDWERALESLERARAYFARKGDRRLEALACLKLSSVYSNYGDPDRSAEMAAAGVEIVPVDAMATRLRLDGNLAITRMLLNEQLNDVVHECQRIGIEAGKRGLEHFAAIADHNAGEILLQLGRVDEGVTSLERAAKFWSGPPTSPFADNVALVLGLLLMGQTERARYVAHEAVRRTEPWPRPSAHSRFGLAAVLAQDGRFAEALGHIVASHRQRSTTGGIHSVIAATRVEYLYLRGAPISELLDAAREIERPPQDQRYFPDTVAGRAIGLHSRGSCSGECLRLLDALSASEAGGAVLGPLMARVKVGIFAFAHRGRRTRTEAWAAVQRSLDRGLGPHLKWWLRMYVSHANLLAATPDGVRLALRLADLDPDGWRAAIIKMIPKMQAIQRTEALQFVSRNANRETVALLDAVPGDDVAQLRRRLIYVQATRLYVRTFGSISIHRGSWAGPEIRLDKRRVRTLLGLLAAHDGRVVTRDAVIDLMWPDADADSAVNSLNQTVFQLRRYLDPNYRAGESPEYVVSTADQVSLNPELVHTDLAELRRLPERVATGDWHHRNAAVGRALDLVAGEFVGDVKYEEWATRLQLSVHNEVRRYLLPIAQSGPDAYPPDTLIRTAEAMLRLDPFDEAAVLALADALAASGRRVVARNLVIDYIRRVRSEMDDEPSSAFISAAALHRPP